MPHRLRPDDHRRCGVSSIASSYDALTLDDTDATPIEDKLLRAIENIEQISVEAREAAEHRRKMEIQRREEQRRAEELRKRAARYSSWPRHSGNSAPPS